MDNSIMLAEFYKMREQYREKHSKLLSDASELQVLYRAYVKDILKQLSVKRRHNVTSLWTLEHLLVEELEAGIIQDALSNVISR